MVLDDVGNRIKTVLKTTRMVELWLKARALPWPPLIEGDSIRRGVGGAAQARRTPTPSGGRSRSRFKKKQLPTGAKTVWRWGVEGDPWPTVWVQGGGSTMPVN